MGRSGASTRLGARNWGEHTFREEKYAKRLPAVETRWLRRGPDSKTCQNWCFVQRPEAAIVMGMKEGFDRLLG